MIRMTILYFGIILLLLSSCKTDTPEDVTRSTVEGTGNPTIDNISKKIQQNPKDPSLYVARAQAFYRMEGYDEAILDMNHAIRMDTTRVDNFLFLAQILLDYNRSKDAIQVLNNAVNRFPENLECRLKQAEYYYVLKQYQQSTAALDAILLRDPQNAQAFFLFGQNFKELKDTVRAIKSFQTAVDMDPDIMSGWINLGNLTAVKGPSIARKYYETALNIDSANVFALNSYALFLGNQDKYKQSINIYRKIALIDPQFSDGFFNAGIMYLMLDSIKQANQQFNLAVKTNPIFGKAYYYRGLTFEKLGLPKKAAADYQNTLNFDAEFEKAKIALAELQGK